jgi:hypothetical protein
VAITLRVENFSCLKDVTFEVAPVTVLIGPQGSGKSLLAKLHYFFCDLMTQYHEFARNSVEVEDRREALEDYQNATSERFIDWFPVSGWGSEAFKISFTAGDFGVEVRNRTVTTSKLSGVDIAFSGFFANHFGNVAQAHHDQMSRLAEDHDNSIADAIKIEQGIYDLSRRLLADRLGSDYVYAQTYIPSGRSLYLARRPIFETQGNSNAGFDSISMQFFRMYDRCYRVFERRNERIIGPVADELLGGDVVFLDKFAYIENRDGRKLPFSLLSSGQQEFLPLYLIANAPTERSNRLGCEMWYVEEPETGLFPSAQSLVTDFLVSSIQGSDNRRNLVLTTHSPYVLSKLNTYLKAGVIGQNSDVAARVSDLVSRACWLTPKRTRVYGLANGTLKNLIGDDDLIDGSYIDDISEDIARTFSALLEIEYQEAAE